jgi:hypothetical protein
MVGRVRLWFGQGPSAAHGRTEHADRRLLMAPFGLAVA